MIIVFKTGCISSLVNQVFRADWYQQQIKNSKKTIYTSTPKYNLLNT